MKRNKCIPIPALLLAVLLAVTVTACTANRQTVSKSAVSGRTISKTAPPSSSPLEALPAIQTPSDTSETAAISDYSAVLELIHSHTGILYLTDVIQYLNDNNLKWEAYYNVSQERVDMTWEDKTTLSFFSSVNQDGYLSEPVLTVLGDTFYNKSFEENYLQQANPDPEADYYPQTALRLLTKNELGNMNETDLSIARNEIYARYGQIFTDPFLQGVFTAKSWYKPLYSESQFQYSLLNDWEKKNLDVIAETETERGYRSRTAGSNVTRLRGLVSGSWISPGGDGNTKEVLDYSLSNHYGGPGTPIGYKLYTSSLQQYRSLWNGDLINYDPTLYTASLDGKTTQLFICGESLAHVPMTDVFTFFDGNLRYVGNMPGGSRLVGGATEIADDGIHIYFPDHTEMTYVYKDGDLQQFPSPSVGETIQKAQQGYIDMPAAYRQFLDGKLAAADGFYEGFPLTSYSEESYFDKMSYTSPRTNLKKSFALADTNKDGLDELFFKMEAGPDPDSPTNKIMFVLGFDGGAFKVYDMFDSRSDHINFSVFDNGNVSCTQSYDGEQEVIYQYDRHGHPKELIRFVSSPTWVKQTDMTGGHYYEEYYVNGDSTNPVKLNYYYEYYKIRSQYVSEPVIWQQLPSLQHYIPEFPAEEQAIKEKLAAVSLQRTEKSNYAAVLDLIKSHSGVCSLDDITLWLDGCGLKWEAYYNVSEEQINMTWEDGTTLLFLRARHEDGSLDDPLLVMINGQFNSQLFQKYYLNQPDAKPESYYFPQTAGRLLSVKELWGFNQTDLSIARNEIYARHGLIFEDPFLRGVFSAKSWYTPLYNKTQFEEIAPGVLNTWEKENLKSISDAETKRGFSFQAAGDVSPLRGLVSGSWISIHGPETKKVCVGYTFSDWANLGMDERAYDLSLSLNGMNGGEVQGNLVSFDRVLYTASLDGSTTQFLVSGETLDHIPATDVYTCTDNRLNYAGSITGSNIAGGIITIAKDGIYVYGQNSDASLSPTDVAKYSFQDGKATQVSAPEIPELKDPSEDALEGIDMPQPYRQFLSGGLKLQNPFNKNFPLSSHAEEGYFNKPDYTFPTASLNRSFSLADTDKDGRRELFFKVTAGPKEMMFLLGLDGTKLKVYDVFDARARSKHFTVYDNGNVDCIQNDNGEQEVIFCYDKNRRKRELIRFVSSENWLKDADMSSGYYYEAYYLNGDDKNPVKLNSLQEYNSIRSQYTDGKEAAWHNLADFTD